MSRFSLRLRKERIVPRAYDENMSSLLTKDWTVKQLMESYPNAQDVFIRLKADCVGCRLDKFCTLEEVARDYGFILGDFLADLQEAVLIFNSKGK